MSRQKGYRYISVDGLLHDSHNKPAGDLKPRLAAIAGIEEGRDVRLLFADIVLVTKSPDAEVWALAVAMDIAEKARYGRVVFRSDSRGTVDLVNGRKASQSRRVNRMRRLLAENASWRVEWIARTHNAAAHVQCSQAMKCYLAGRRGDATLLSDVAG